MKNKVVINDTADVIWKRISDGHTVFTTEAQLASISQAVDEEKLYGGIGNRPVALLRSNKEIDLAVRNALWDLEYLSMTQGVAVEPDGKAQVKKIEALTVQDNGGELIVEISDTAIDGEVVVYDIDGSQSSVLATGKEVVVSEGFKAKEGDDVTVIYKREVTGESVAFDSKKFSEKYSVEYQTIAYDPETMLPVYDIYIQFYEVIPSGEFEMSLENGTALTPELNFTVVAPAGETVMGRIVRVPYED